MSCMNDGQGCPQNSARTGMPVVRIPRHLNLDKVLVYDQMRFDT